MKLILATGKSFSDAYERLAEASRKAQNFLLTDNIHLSNDKHFKGFNYQ